MTTISNRAIGYRVYDAINAGDLEALEKLFDPQVVRHATGETGFESARAAMKTAFAAFPEMRFAVDDVLADGDRIALRVTVHGMPTPPDQPLPIIMEIFRIEDGRVAEIWGAGTLRVQGSGSGTTAAARLD